MKNPKNFIQDQENQLENRIIELRQELFKRPIQNLVQSTGTDFNEDLQRFEFLYWNQTTQLTYPDFISINSTTQQPLNVFHQALVLYYFLVADGAPLENHWVSFNELPEGRFYNQAYQSYTGKTLFQKYGEDLGKLEKAAQTLHGESIKFADLAFRFQILPRVVLLLACWQGDEDFPSTYQILFDASIVHYLPTDACAIAGKLLTHKLMAVYS